MPIAAESPAQPPKEVEEKSEDVPERYPFKLVDGIKIYTIKGTPFELPEYLVVTERLGSGSYGMVVSAIDTRTKERVAIKKCSSLFKYPEDGKRILREIKLMSMLDHRNILGIKDVLPFPGPRFEDVYLIMERMDTDLGNIIRSQRLTESHCKYIIYQILRGMKYIHSANVLHRDLKPANILINWDCRAKICDFGLARGTDPTQPKQQLTNYVVTRWYRAPELLLDNKHYTAAIDVWAAGCIFSEMLRGTALFPGESSVDQIRLLIDGIGIPPDDDLWWVESPKSREYLKRYGGKENRAPGQKKLLPSDAKPLAFDFVKHMLAFNPYKRWNAEWLLNHPYLADVHRPATCTRSQQVFRWRWDSEYPDEHKLRQLFWTESLVFHPEVTKRWGVLPAELATPTTAAQPPEESTEPRIPSAAVEDLREEVIAVAEEIRKANELKEAKRAATSEPDSQGMNLDKPDDKGLRRIDTKFTKPAVTLASKPKVRTTTKAILPMSIPLTKRDETENERKVDVSDDKKDVAPFAQRRPSSGALPKGDLTKVHLASRPLAQQDINAHK